ncbi:MAG: PIN domain-containing protein [Bacteroidota bacterium]
MAAFLLDTHTLLWHLGKSEKNSSQAYDIITHPEHSIYVSIASYWEMTIKASLGKLNLPIDIKNFDC